MDTRRGADGRDRPSAPPPPGAETSSVQIVDLETVRNGGRRGSNTVFVVAALVVVALLLGVVVGSPRTGSPAATAAATIGVALTSPSPEASVAITPAPTGPRATPGPRSPAPTPYPWEWRSLVVDAFVSGIKIERMWTLVDRYVALVSEYDEQSESPPNSLMVSTDGVNWARGLLPTPGFVVSGGAVADGRLSIIGHADTTAGPRYELWSTTDTVSWSAEGALEGFPVGWIDVLQMAHGDAGWVAVVDQRPTRDLEPVGMSILSSPDGVRWNTAKKLAYASGESASGLATDGQRWVLAMVEPRNGVAVDVTVLRSTDGLAWTAYPVATIEGDVAGIAVDREGGFVIAGTVVGSGSIQAMIWSSPGGRTWTMKPLGMAAGHTPVGITGIVTTELGYLAFSYDNGETWQSYDGVAWRNVAIWHDAGVGHLEGLTTRGSNVVAWGPGREAGETIFLGDLACMLPAGC